MSNEDPIIGSMIKEYRIESLIGTGTTGNVYLAKHPGIGKRLAVKSLKQELCTNEKSLKSFFQEAKTIAQLHHENVVNIFDFIHEPQKNQCYILMEYLEGKILSESIRNEAPFTLNQLSHIGLQICSALYAAHQKQIIYRDLKPDNILLLTKAGQKNFVKIFDFGMAKIIYAQNQNQEKSTTTIEAKPDQIIYISPEQILGKETDITTDIYSIGVILYEMSTNNLPFEFNSVGDLIEKMTLSKPTPPRQFSSHIQPELETLILRCLQKKPSERYASIEDLAAELAALSGLDLNSYIAEAPSRLSPKAKKSDAPIAFEATLRPEVNPSQEETNTNSQATTREAPIDDSLTSVEVTVTGVTLQRERPLPPTPKPNENTPQKKPANIIKGAALPASIALSASLAWAFWPSAPVPALRNPVTTPVTPVAPVIKTIESSTTKPTTLNTPSPTTETNNEPVTKPTKPRKPKNDPNANKNITGGNPFKKPK